MTDAAECEDGYGLTDEDYNQIGEIVESISPEELAPEPPKPRYLKPEDGEPFRPFFEQIRMSDVEAKEVEWLWYGRIPAGKLTLLSGDGAVGKSFFSLDIAARLSTGTPWPDRIGVPIEAGNTVVISCEDAPDDTIKPRLNAAEADPTRITWLAGVIRTPDGLRSHPNLANDLKYLEDAIGDTNARLAIIDPISAYLGGKDSHSNSEVREVLGPLAQMAADTGCAILAITHLNKSQALKAAYRSMGSVAFTAQARMGWMITKDEVDARRRNVTPIKANLTEEPPGLSFEIVDGRIHWDAEPCNLTSDQALNGANIKAHKARDEAAEWLAELLLPGPMNAKRIYELAAEKDFSIKTLDRASREMRIRKKRNAVGMEIQSEWSLRDEEEVPF
jgi:hypothetical protein